jgi:hypothetical protein
MNIEIAVLLIFEIFSGLLPIVAGFIFGLCLLAAVVVLVVKAVSFKS